MPGAYALAESERGASPAASGLDSPLVATQAASASCHQRSPGFSTEEQHLFYVLLSGIRKHNYTPGLFMGNEASGKSLVTRRFTHITPQVSDKGL